MRCIINVEKFCDIDENQLNKLKIYATYFSASNVVKWYTSNVLISIQESFSRSQNVISTYFSTRKIFGIHISWSKSFWHDYLAYTFILLFVCFVVLINTKVIFHAKNWLLSTRIMNSCHRLHSLPSSMKIVR